MQQQTTTGEAVIEGYVWNLTLWIQGQRQRWNGITGFQALFQALLLFNTSGESGSGDLDSNQCGWWEAMTKLDSILKSRDITLLTKVCKVKTSFSSSHVRMWELACEESWALKNWCFWTVVLEKTLESPLDCKEIKPVNPKGNQSWIFTGRTDAEAPIFWPPDGKSQLIGKDPDPGKDWRQKEKGVKKGQRMR